MIFLKTEDEIELMRAANQLVSRTLTEVGKLVKPGVTTKDLDKVAGEFIRDHGAIPTFYGFPNPYGAPFPANICTSINDVVVHGIPDETPLEEGNIVSIDCGALLNGFNGDSCYTFRVGNVSTEINALLNTTKEALYKGIEMAVNGRRIGDVSHAIESHCTEHGYGVVREFVGHGIGRDMHEEPHVPNYGKAGNGKLIRNGLCIAIEPMIVQYGREIYLMPDKWTVKTRDRGYAAHYEHTIAVHNGKPEILSSFEEIEMIENQY